MRFKPNRTAFASTYSGTPKGLPVGTEARILLTSTSACGDCILRRHCAWHSA